MLRILLIIGEWLLKNAVQRILLGAGLAIVSYMGVLVVIRATFNSLISNINSVAADMINLMGIYGIDYVLSSLISVSVFLLTLNSGKLALRKK